MFALTYFVVYATVFIKSPHQSLRAGFPRITFFFEIFG